MNLFGEFSPLCGGIIEMRRFWSFGPLMLQDPNRHIRIAVWPLSDAFHTGAAEGRKFGWDKLFH